ncbi:MAG: ATP-binding protein [Tepidisphaeraceae bacterium]
MRTADYVEPRPEVAIIDANSLTSDRPRPTLGSRRESMQPDASTSVTHRTARIVLTGAPGSGKTTIAAALAKLHPNRFILVPEAATQYYTSLGRRWDQLDIKNRKEAQRGIYRLQVEQETRLARTNPDKTLLLDRGTVDGSAYWPDGPDEYWQDLGTTLADELARYDRVLILQTSAHLGLYDGDASNRVRFEDAAGAIANEKLIEQIWKPHPHRIIVHAEADFGRKLAAVEAAVLHVR